MGSTTVSGGGGRGGDHDQGQHVYGRSEGGHWGSWTSWLGGSNGGGREFQTTGGLHGHGNDTINVGSGRDSLAHAGSASVHGAFGGSHQFAPLSHGATLVGGAHSTNFVQHSLATHHGMGMDSAAGSHAPMHSSNLHVAFANVHVSPEVIKNFVSGHDKLLLEGKALSYLPSHSDVSVNHGGTVIHLDGGSTTVSLKGIAHNIVGHK